MHLFTEGLTIKTIFPVLNEQFISKNFKMIQDRLFGIQTLKSLIYEQATAFNSLEEKIKTFDEKIVKVEARINLRQTTNQKLIERNRLEFSNFVSTTSTNMSSLQSQLNNLLSLITRPRTPRSPRTPSRTPSSPTPFQPTTPAPRGQAQYDEALLLLKPVVLEQLQEIPVQRSYMEEAMDGMLGRIESLEEKVGGVGEGLAEARGRVGKVEEELARIGRVISNIGREKGVVSQPTPTSSVQRVVETKLDQTELNKLTKQILKIKLQAEQQHKQQNTILQRNKGTLAIVLQQFKALRNEFSHYQQLKEQVDIMEHQKATREQAKSLKSQLEALQARFQAIPSTDYLISRLQSIVDPQITAHYDSFQKNLRAELSPIRTKLDYLSRTNDNGMAIKTLREELLAVVGEERRGREELACELPARFTVQLGAERAALERRIGEVEDGFRGGLLGKADTLEIEQLRQSFYGSLSELIERVNQKFSNKIETKRILTFHEERLEELFELFMGRREQEQALRGRMAGLVRCISCCRELGQTTQRIHKEAPKQAIPKKLSLRRLERTVNKQ